jgi:hypothetical protein
MSSRFLHAPGQKFLPVAVVLLLAVIVVSPAGLAAGTGEAAGIRGAVGLEEAAGPRGEVGSDGLGGSGRSQAPDRAFGYFVGEERRYILGPDDSLLDREGRDWVIRLDRIEGGTEDFVAVFALEFEDRMPGISYQGSQEVYFRVEGELKVNRFGFPLELRYTEGEEQSGEAPWRGEPRITSYEYDAEERRYNKTVNVPDQKLDYTIPVARHSDLDLDLPSGLFMYLPASEGDSALVNPGLLSLALPAQVDAALPNIKLLLLAPSSTPRFLDADWIVAERNGRTSVGRNYETSEIRMVEQTSVELGNRTVPAWRLELSRFHGAVYVDDAGLVLRVDINRHPRTSAPRWIRLLHPSEY